MKKLIIAALALTLAACGEHPATLPPPPKTTEVVTRDIPVPVLCTVELKRAKVKLNDLQKGSKLEEQNAALRESIAQQQAYIIQLEAGIIGCGGKITDQ